MVQKLGEIKKPTTSSLKFCGNPFSGGATSGTLLVRLSTNSLKGAGGSSPSSKACTIVDEFSAKYDLREHVDLGQVKKALSNPSVAQKIVNATSPQKMLELLGLRGLLLMADYNNLNAAGFVKGHLWPQRLGGPGVDWNLTPMDRSANALWQSSFEKAVYTDLQKAKKVEKNSDFRIIVDYTVSLKGKLSPWFSNPSAATKTLLAQLPGEVVGKAKIFGFESKSGSKKVISAAEQKQFPAFGMSLSLKL